MKDATRNSDVDDLMALVEDVWGAYLLLYLSLALPYQLFCTNLYHYQRKEKVRRVSERVLLLLILLAVDAVLLVAVLVR
eukprot:scaffold80668_cov79-Cyclotella_meneghiniana.AAC.1